MQEKISIIVPVYNAQRWLEQCLESLRNQTYENTEIILIDDGSRDASAAICERYAGEHQRIRVIHQQNAGVSAARNAGLEHASGRYVLFVDADDYMETETLQKVQGALDTECPGLLCFGYFQESSGISVPVPIAFPEDSTRSQLRAAMIAGYGKKNGISGIYRSPWAKVYDMDVIRKYQIRFHEEIALGEDAVFNLEYLNHAESIRVNSFHGYHYRVMQDSSARKYRPDAADQYILQGQAIANAMRESGESDALTQDALSVFCWRMFDLLIDDGHRHAKEGTVSKTGARAETKRFYEQMKPLVSQCEDPSWADRVVRISDRLSTKCPFAVQYAAVAACFFKRKVVGKLRALKKGGQNHDRQRRGDRASSKRSSSGR